MLVDIFLVDTRLSGKKIKPDPSLPFQRFYLIPKSESLVKFRRLAPYSLVVPLTGGYEYVLTACGIPFKELLEQGYRVMVPIPMTQTYKENGSRLAPWSLTTDSWRKAAESRLADFLSDTNTTLLTPEEEVTPICLTCEHHLEHLVGECVLGTPICLEYLSVRYTPAPMKEDPELVSLNITADKRK